MVSYQKMSIEALRDELDVLQSRYADFQAQGLKLNMARGKPAFDQLDLALGLLDVLSADQRPIDLSGEDTRNYGILRGITEARVLMGKLLGVSADLVVLGNNASLTMMYDTVARAVLFGLRGSLPQSQQAQQTRLRFLCPSPGYDRHFAISRAFGFENMPIPMRADGPDMDLVEQYVSQDPTVKGIWCVPKYSNPQGITYSDQVVRRFAALKPAAPDFRIYWDNAYAVHDLYPDTPKCDTLLNLKEACDEAGSSDIWYMFASTSKISFAGAGIAAMASSEANLVEIEAHLSIQTIGSDKVNQLRHVRWLESLAEPKGDAIDGVYEQMRRLASLLAPKFEAVDEVLTRELDGLDVASWVKPRGGYFISLESYPDTARRAVGLAKEAGVTLTDAGATWPDGNDPADSNIRIAPSYPTMDELKLASELFAVCLKMAAAEKILEERH
jgi:aspartate/methionine/tyrosine aminotransferase